MLVILNPQARGGAGRSLQPEIERELSARGVSCRIALTAGAGAATELARDAAAAGEPVVVAAGGDGTAHEVANGLLQAADAGAGDTALGVIPIGTGNDFVKVVPGTSSRPAAYDTLARGRRYRYDAGHVSWAGGSEYFLNAMGTGIDVEVVRQILARSRRTGQLVYIAGLLRALRRYRPVHLRLETGGETLELRVMTIAIANGTCIGGLFRICPAALPDDGWLDLCVVAELGAARIPGMALRLFGGRHAGHPAVAFRRVRQARIQVLDHSPLFFQLDGELREPVGVHELDVTIQPSRLTVIAADGRGGAPTDTRE
jgi:YegS/Rv2252/BmrU family lipid kinase